MPENITMEDLRGIVGDEAMPEVTAELSATPPAQRPAKAARIAKIAKSSQGALGAVKERSAWRMILKWAQGEGIPIPKLRVERARFFHKQIIDLTLANQQPSYTFFDENGGKPVAAATNMPDWGKFPLGTLALLMGLPQLDVAVHVLDAAVDRSAVTYLPMVDRFIGAIQYKHIVNQSELIPIPGAALPPAGGAFATAIRHEQNGWPSAENRLVLDSPVQIKGGLRFSAFLLLDTDTTRGLGSAYGASKLRVTMMLDMYYARTAG